ncbi:MAG TPA: hypothetical protein VND64_13605 [Pirellulales bacterium]|nr:hypothetical protein [Pirellulales bacterium]
MEHRTLTLQTSPGNYQAWLAVLGGDAVFAGGSAMGAEPRASGDTRISARGGARRQFLLLAGAALPGRRRSISAAPKTRRRHVKTTGQTSAGPISPSAFWRSTGGDDTDSRRLHAGRRQGP